jgi:hypothetical protein
VKSCHFKLDVPPTESRKVMACDISEVPRKSYVDDDRIAQESVSATCPDTILRTRSNATLCLDKDSASEL